MTDDSAMADALADGLCHRLRMSRAFWRSGGFSAGLGRRRDVATSRRRDALARRADGSTGSTAGMDACRYAGSMRGTQGESR